MNVDSKHTERSPRPRFLSEADCHDIADRLARYAKGGGETNVRIVSQWTANVRWARNRVTTTGENRENFINLIRIVRGARSYNSEIMNEVSDAGLVAAARRAERLVLGDAEQYESDIITTPHSPFRQSDEPFTVAPLFFDSTYQLDAAHRAEAARHSVQGAVAAGMLSAGYVEVSATSMAAITSWGYSRYTQYTWARYSTTVRDPKGVGSGWAGVDWPDWQRIDGEKLSAIALDKCLKSRNPVAIEPGRYTTILEPQAVCDFVGGLMFDDTINREANEKFPGSPFHHPTAGLDEPPNLGNKATLGLSRMSEKVIDERISISADPLDPDLGFPPFNKPRWEFNNVQAYHPATWIDHGVLKTLSYNRGYATSMLGQNTGLPNSGSFRMSVSGATSTIEEMIDTTKRGILVTRFDRVNGEDGRSISYRGYTRDGLWLIEDGKISKSIKNMVFVESVLFALNNVDLLGVPQRVFHPLPSGTYPPYFWNPRPVIVPALKIRDFSFTALTSAI